MVRFFYFQISNVKISYNHFFMILLEIKPESIVSSPVPEQNVPPPTAQDPIALLRQEFDQKLGNERSERQSEHCRLVKIINQQTRTINQQGGEINELKNAKDLQRREIGELRFAVNRQAAEINQQAVVINRQAGVIKSQEGFLYFFYFILMRPSFNHVNIGVARILCLEDRLGIVEIFSDPSDVELGSSQDQLDAVHAQVSRPLE